MQRESRSYCGSLLYKRSWSVRVRVQTSDARLAEQNETGGISWAAKILTVEEPTRPFMSLSIVEARPSRSGAAFPLGESSR
jgi:hypothetical protein